MHRRVKLAWVLALLALAGAAQARVPASGAAQAAVPVCLTNFPPYVSADLPGGGPLTALARRAFAAEGLTLRTIEAPWARALVLATHGDCLLLALWRNAERDALFSYSLPVAQMQLGLFVPGRPDAPLADHAHIAYQRGSHLPPALTQGGYQLDPVVDMHPALQMLQRGRVDAVFSERASFEYLLDQQPAPRPDIHWMSPALQTMPTHMAVSRKHPQARAWLEILDREIRRSAHR